MKTILKERFYSKIPNDKIKINWNKNPIKMDLFLSFLTVPYEKSTDHLGSCNGWTKYYNDDIKLYLQGGIVQGHGHYLDNIQYGKNLDNPYNNYVNPFYIFDIFNDEGKLFFINYYKDEIDGIINKSNDKILSLEKQLSEERRVNDILNDEVAFLNPPRG